MQYTLATRYPMPGLVPRLEKDQSLIIIIIVQVVSMQLSCATPRCSTPRSLSRTRSTAKTPYRSVEGDLFVKFIGLLIIARDYVCTGGISVHALPMFLNKKHLLVNESLCLSVLLYVKLPLFRPVERTDP